MTTVHNSPINAGVCCICGVTTEKIDIYIYNKNDGFIDSRTVLCPKCAEFYVALGIIEKF